MYEKDRYLENHGSICLFNRRHGSPGSDYIGVPDKEISALNWIWYWLNEGQSVRRLNKFIQRLIHYEIWLSWYNGKGLCESDVDFGKWNFGIRRIKKLKALLHWAQEFRRISERPSVEGMTGDDFLLQLDRALERTKVWEQYHEDSDKKSKEASLGPLKSQR